MTPENKSEYRFIKSFGLTRFILNEENSIDSILTVLRNSLETKQTRHIIDYGIKKYCEKSEDFQCVDNIHKQITIATNSSHTTKSTQQDTINTDHDDKTKANKSHCHKTFAIKNIACNIFKYLDFKSKNKCKTVNIGWLYNLYHCDSNGTLDIGADLFAVESMASTYDEDGYDLRLSNICGTIKDLSNYHNINKITITEWPSDLNKYFHSFFTQLKQIQHLTINQTEENGMCITQNTSFQFDSQFASIIINLLENNCNNIKTINIYLWEYDIIPDSWQSILHQMKEIKFSKLEQFKITSDQLAITFQHDSDFVNFITSICDIQSKILNNRDNINSAHGDDHDDQDKVTTTDYGTIMLETAKSQSNSEAPLVDKIYLEQLVQGIYNLYKKSKIKIIIHVRIYWWSPNRNKLIKIITDEMKRLNFIKYGVDDVKEYDLTKTDQWKGDIRWYSTDDEYTCELFDSKIKIIKKQGWLTIETNN